MSKTFLTADTHFSHGNIIKYCNRPFLSKEEQQKFNADEFVRVSRESVEHMDAHIIDGINKTVGKNDLLIHLGDFCFGPRKQYYEVAKRYRERINCKNIILIWGNHDHRIIKNLFSATYDLHKMTIHNQKVILCHYAMAIWDGSHHGTWQLYGHSHSSAEENLDRMMPGRRSMDVGIDNAYKILGEYRPFSFDEIRNLIKEKEGFSFDHHESRKEKNHEEKI